MLLARLMHNHGETVEADFAHYYPGIDLLDFYRGKMSVRKLWVLVQGLPFNSKTARRLHGLDSALDDWTLTDILLGRLLEAWSEEGTEVVPRSTLPTIPTAAAPRQKEIPIVSLSEAMGFVNSDPDTFAEKYAPTR